MQGGQRQTLLWALLATSLGHPYSGAQEIRVKETGWLHSQLAGVLGTGGFAPGRRAGRRFGLCGFGSNKEIPCNPPNLLSISPPPAPRPALPARCEAPKVSEAAAI